MLNNPDFYPTPPKVIEKMLLPFLGEKYKTTEHNRYSGDYEVERYRNIDLWNATILEPSAGKGNILEYLEKALTKRIHYAHESSIAKHVRQRCYCIESDLELAATLQGKGYRLVGHDFMSYQGDRVIDFIIANPPFSDGTSHVLKMWDVIAPGGHVVTLLNSESVHNPYTEERKLLAKHIADHGSVEHLGAVFQEAERKTDVQVCLIRLKKPESTEDRFTFEFGQRTRSRTITEEDLTNGVARKDLVGNMMVCFKELQGAFLNMAHAHRRLEFFGRDVIEASQIKDSREDMLTVALRHLKENGTKAAYNDFSDEVQQSMWRSILGKINIQQLLTHKIREDFDKYAAQNGYLDFTKENVAQLVETLLGNRSNILEQAIVAVFDIFTSYHKENRLHVQGWKTNDKWKVNRKIILPRWVRWGEYGIPDNFSTCYHNSSQYSDIDKAMAYITGKKYEGVVVENKVVGGVRTIRDALEAKFKRVGSVGRGHFDGTCQSEFFDLKFHKSGTLHITFRDKMLWEEFNLRACAGKLWLPEHEEQQFRKRKRSPFDPKPATPEPEPFTPPARLQLAAPAPVWQTQLLPGTCVAL